MSSFTTADVMNVKMSPSFHHTKVGEILINGQFVTWRNMY